MKKNTVIWGALCIISSNIAMAGTMGPVVKSWAPVVTLSAGPVWTNSGNTQTFYLDPFIEKTYSADHNTSTMFNGEIFLGLQHALNTIFSGQLGLAFAGATNASINGEIWDDADPQFNNYIYSYRINHVHVAVKGKLLADMGYMVTPYVSGSVGVGSNRANNFTNLPVIFEAVVNPNFGSHSQTAFSYTAGAGVQKVITQNLQVGVGYEFASWGHSRLDIAQGQTLGTGLTLNNLYTNGLIFNVTYVA